MGPFPSQKPSEFGTGPPGKERDAPAPALGYRFRELDLPGHVGPIRGNVANIEANELPKAKAGTQGKGQQSQIPTVFAYRLRRRIHRQSRQRCRL